jgi:hypothetical protein
MLLRRPWYMIDTGRNAWRYQKTISGVGAFQTEDDQHPAPHLQAHIRRNPWKTTSHQPIIIFYKWILLFYPAICPSRPRDSWSQISVIPVRPIMCESQKRVGASRRLFLGIHTIVPHGDQCDSRNARVKECVICPAGRMTSRYNHSEGESFGLTVLDSHNTCPSVES